LGRVCEYSTSGSPSENYSKAPLGGACFVPRLRAECAFTCRIYVLRASTRPLFCGSTTCAKTIARSLGTLYLCAKLCARHTLINQLLSGQCALQQTQNKAQNQEPAAYTVAKCLVYFYYKPVAVIFFK
jgi:hypothetical protein